MPYFFILPVFLLLEVFILAAALTVLKYPKYRWANGYLIGALWGSALGFIAANLLLWAACTVPAIIAQKCALPDPVQSFAKFFLAIGLLLGPFAASAGGFAAGVLFGAYSVYRRRRAG